MVRMGARQAMVPPLTTDLSCLPRDAKQTLNPPYLLPTKDAHLSMLTPPLNSLTSPGHVVNSDGSQ